MLSKKKQKQNTANKATKHLSSMYPVPPPVPPRPVMPAMKLPRKSAFREHVGLPALNSHQMPNPKYIHVPSNSLYISSSCDNVHKMTRQPYLLNESVYSNCNSHAIMGQHIRNEQSQKNGMWFLKSSSSIKLSSKPLKHSFVGSHPDINSYKHLVNLSKNQWMPESRSEHKSFMKEKIDHANYVYLNGYDYCDQRYFNSYHHKSTIPIPCYPVRKFSSANSSSSSRSSSKSKTSTNCVSSSDASSNSYTNVTFNQSTFRAEDFRCAKNKHLAQINPSNSSKLTSSKKENESHDYRCVSSFSKYFPLSAKMASLHGLPPLPKSLSGINLQNDVLVDNNRVQNSTPLQPSLSIPQTSAQSNEGRKARLLPTPPASLSQNSISPANYMMSSARKPVSLDAKLTILRQEMFGLRQLDLSLLSQLWSLNESIQEFRQLQESMSIPSPSDDGEDGDELLYSNLTPVSGRMYRNLCRNGGDSSSSSSSIDFGKV